MDRDSRVRNARSFMAEKPDTMPDKGNARIFVLRHGKTALDDTHRSDGWIDLPLSDEGRQGIVEVLADYLKPIPIEAIYAAPLKRTEETAHILCSGFPDEPEMELDDALMTWNLGSLSGSPKLPNKPVVEKLLKRKDEKAPDGESYNEFTKRFDDYFGELQDKVEDGSGPFLVVLSGSNCRRLGEALLGDRMAFDLDESGLGLCYEDGDGWDAKVISGKKEIDDEAS